MIYHIDCVHDVCFFCRNPFVTYTSQKITLWWYLWHGAMRLLNLWSIKITRNNHPHENNFVEKRLHWLTTFEDHPTVAASNRTLWKATSIFAALKLPVASQKSAPRLVFLRTKWWKPSEKLPGPEEERWALVDLFKDVPWWKVGRSNAVDFLARHFDCGREWEKGAPRPSWNMP